MRSPRRSLRTTITSGFAVVVLTAGLQTVWASPAYAEEEDNCPSVEPVDPDDISDTELWAHDLLDVERAWPTTQGGGVRVAVIDSGVEASLDSVFGDRVQPGEAYIDKVENEKAGSGDRAQEDCDGHGTGVAGIIGGKKLSNGFYGMAPKSEILPIRVANQRPDGSAQDTDEDEENEDPVVTESQFADAIDDAVDADADVINLSVKYGNDNPDIRAAVKRALNNDVLVVAAAGNEGTEAAPTDSYPAAYEHDAILGVGAVNSTLTRVPESQAGPWVDLVGPGAEVAAPLPDGSFDPVFGMTSSATAFVSGAAALLRAQHPDWDATDVAKHLIGTASTTPGGDGKSLEYGYGFVDPYRAVTEKLHHNGEQVDTSVVERPEVSDSHAAKDEFLANARKWGLWIGLGAVAFFAAALTGVGALRRAKKYGWRVKKANREDQIEPFDDGDPVPLFQGIKGLKQ